MSVRPVERKSAAMEQTGATAAQAGSGGGGRRGRGMTDSAPRGIVVLMFTDIEDSSPLWEQMGDRFRPVLQRHNQLIRERIQAWDGYEVKSQGDSFMVAFPRGTDAVQSAL